MGNVFAKNWMSVLVEAVRHRLTQATTGSKDSICISRSSFDDLVGIVDAVVCLNISSHAAKIIQIAVSENGFTCTLDNPYIKATGSGDTLLEALSAALHDFDVKVEEYIR